jgi:hypothetical protein
MRNCASGNLEIPGSMLAHRPGMTFGHFPCSWRILAWIFAMPEIQRS